MIYVSFGLLLFSPLWLCLLFFTKVRATRFILLGTVILLLLTGLLFLWISYDCGTGDLFGGLGSCGLTPEWLADALFAILMLGFYLAFWLLPVVIAAALIVELSGRYLIWRERRVSRSDSAPE